jgi:2,4-dienoyl-CoA reductase [(3E)-enoyl-CoA-producing], peroxisomal
MSARIGLYYYTMAAAVSSPFCTDCLTGKVALITGGGSGIGFEIARQLLHHGCRGVVICGRRQEFLARAASALLQEQEEEMTSSSSSLQQQQQTQQQQQKVQVLYQVCDVRNYNDCQAVIHYCQANFQRLDILVNGAAGNFLARASDLSPKGFATVMAIDALGTFNMSRAAYALLKETSTKSSRNSNNNTTPTTTTTVIINISATLQSPATWWQAHASAAKSAVDSLTRSLALEWGSADAGCIRVVGIAPGPIAHTPGTTKLAPPVSPTTSAVNNRGDESENNKKSSSLTSMIQQGIPLQRMGEAYEIGHAVVYLATAQYVTGDVLIVDGGQWLYKPPIVPENMVAQLSRQVEAASRAQAPTTRMHQSKL